MVKINYTITEINDSVGIFVKVNVDYGDNNVSYTTLWPASDNYTEIFVSVIDYNISLFDMLNRMYGLLLNYTDWQEVYRRFNVSRTMENIANENISVLHIEGFMGDIKFRLAIAEKYGLLIERTIMIPTTPKPNATENTTLLSLQDNYESFKLIDTNAFECLAKNNETNTTQPSQQSENNATTQPTPTNNVNNVLFVVAVAGIIVLSVLIVVLPKVRRFIG